MTIITELIGFSAAFVGTTIMIPQVIKSIKTKKVDDLAWGMLFLFILNCTLWIVYGFLISALPVTVSNFIVLIIIIVLSVLKYKYSSHK